MLLQRLLPGLFLRLALGFDQGGDALLILRQLLGVGLQGVLRGALGPLYLLDGRGVLLVEQVQLFLVALQALLQLGHPLFVRFHLVALALGVLHVLLQLVHQLLVVLAHHVQKLRAQGEIAEAVGLQQDLEGADVPRLVQGHHPLFKGRDGAGHLLLGLVQLHGQLVDVLV